MRKLFKGKIRRSRLQSYHTDLEGVEQELQAIFGETILVSNVHDLLHLVRGVIKNGPLWATSANGTEAFNSIINSFVHGTYNITEQLCSNILSMQEISLWVDLVENEHLLALLSRLGVNQIRGHAESPSSATVFRRSRRAASNRFQVGDSRFFCVGPFTRHENGETFHKAILPSSSKCDDSGISWKDESGKRVYGRVLRFFRDAPDSENVFADVQRFDNLTRIALPLLLIEDQVVVVRTLDETAFNGEKFVGPSHDHVM